MSDRPQTEVPMPDILDAACSVWQYHCLNEVRPKDIKSFDLIVGLGTYDVRVAERCADLYHQDLSRQIVFTGGKGTITKKIFRRSEAEAYANVAQKNQVKKAHIALETKALNTGENIRFVKKMFPKAKSAIFVTTPQMQRRCRATLDKIWPELEISFITSPDLHLISQATEDVDLNKVIHEVVGNYARIRTYPKRGYQSEQEFSESADKAFQKLIGEGYTQHMPDNWQEDMAAIA